MGGGDVGTPKIPSFEEALGSLKVESPLGAVVTSSLHRRLAELRLAETIAWLFLVLNTKGPSPYGGGGSTGVLPLPHRICCVQKLRSLVERGAGRLEIVAF